MNVVDLKSIDWNHKFDKTTSLKPTNPAEVKKIVALN